MCITMMVIASGYASSTNPPATIICVYYENNVFITQTMLSLLELSIIFHSSDFTIFILSK